MVLVQTIADFAMVAQDTRQCYFRCRIKCKDSWTALQGGVVVVATTSETPDHLSLRTSSCHRTVNLPNRFTCRSLTAKWYYNSDTQKVLQQSYWNISQCQKWYFSHILSCAHIYTLVDRPDLCSTVQVILCLHNTPNSRVYLRVLITDTIICSELICRTSPLKTKRHFIFRSG